MTRKEFLELMHFPSAWDELGMYPEQLFNEQFARYEAGHEESSEHDRNGAFHWWLRRNPSKDVLLKLVRLTSCDPDSLMAADVRSYISKANNCDADVRGEIEKASAI